MSSEKQKRGLPASFQLNVPKAALERPVDLGEYLDDEPSVLSLPVRKVTTTSTPEVERTRTEPAQVLEFKAAPDSAFLSPAPLPSSSESEVQEELPVLANYQPVHRPPRKQFNMNPETLRMVEELLDLVCKQSVQKDIKASELFHSLVSLVFEARDRLDLSQVKPRGKWGTPTAKAFPISLKNAFALAVLESISGGKR